MKPLHAVIIGGGISGLSAAYFLSKRAAGEHIPLKITLLEASARFGGVLRTLGHGDLRMEAAADSFYAGEEIHDLCFELGLGEDLIEAAPCFRRFFSIKDRRIFSLRGFPDSLSEAAGFLVDPRLSFPTKCRMFGEPFIRRREATGDESLADLIRRRFGAGFYQEAVRPLVRSLYMMDPERVSVEALFPRLKQAEEKFGSITRSLIRKIGKTTPEFLTLRSGLESLIRALVEKLTSCERQTSKRVRECAYRQGWEVRLENGIVLRPDLMGIAMNAFHAAKLLEPVPELSRILSQFRYDSIASIGLMYAAEDMPRGCPDAGFLVPGCQRPESFGEILRDKGRYPFSSLKWLGSSSDGKSRILRAFISETMDPEIFQRDDETLKQKMKNFLKDHFNIRAPSRFSAVERYANALPHYEVGHFEKVRRAEEMFFRYPGLFVTGNFFRGFGMSDCICQGKVVASNLRMPARQGEV